jgi:YfiH family protein
LGGAPTVTGQLQKIFDFVSSWAWTSSPMTGKTRVLSSVSEEDTAKNLSTRIGENDGMPRALFVAPEAPDGVLVAFSERGVAPGDTPSPTAHLARRFAVEVGVPETPIVRATQVHGRHVVEIESLPRPGEVVDAGECDALVTRVPGVALVVQTADCVPVLLAAPDAVGAIHAGWRGAAADVVGAGAEAFLRLTREPESVRAWLGPAIRSCCYEVGGEVAARFAGDFVRASCDGRFRLDLPSAVRSRLVSAGVAPERIVADGACTRCGGERYASYRRDRENAGRMIAFVMRRGG